MNFKAAFQDDICVSCGEYVPEGRQVCHECEKATENKLRVSESFMINIDISNGDDISVLQTIKYSNGKREVINTMYGEEAEWTYRHLTTNPHSKLHCTDFQNANWKKANPNIEQWYKDEFASFLENDPRRLDYFKRENLCTSDEINQSQQNLNLSAVKTATHDEYATLSAALDHFNCKKLCPSDQLKQAIKEKEKEK